ncbi:hypothetical protein [Priestia aryabhattai]
MSEVLLQSISTNLLFLKGVTGEINLNPLKLEEEVYAQAIRELIKPYLEAVGRYQRQTRRAEDLNPEIKNMLSLFLNESVREATERGYTKEFKQEEFNKLLLITIEDLIGEESKDVYSFFCAFSKRMYNMQEFNDEIEKRKAALDI